MPVAAIIGGSSLLGGIGSALIGSNASQKASQAQVQAQQQAIQAITNILSPILKQGYDIVGEGRDVLGPAVTTLTGTGQSMIGSVLPILTALLTPGANQTQVLSQLPGFQFAQDWGQKAVMNMGTTMGLGGNTLAQGAQYATGLAQQGWGDLVNALSRYLGQGIGTLQGVGGIGQGLISTGLGTQAQAAGGLAGGVQSATSSIGNAQAGGILGSANAISGGLTGALGGASNAALLYGLTNKLNSGGGVANGIYGGYNYGNSDLASAAQAGVQSGLSFNPETGVVG